MNEQYLRKASLILTAGTKGLDLSEMRFSFKTSQADEESPNNCIIRVYNLSEATVRSIRKEYSYVVLQAGYPDNFGVIFAGNIKQFKVGKEPNNIDSYMDILAADGDLGYNFSTVNKTLAAGSTPGDRVAVAVAAMTPNGVTAGKMMIPSTGGVLPRGKVLWGMAKAIIRAETQNVGATWSIQNGKVQIIPLTGYLPGEAVLLNAQSGLIGRPEQTEDGIKVKCLLNPKIAIGGSIKIDNAAINQIIQQNPSAPAGPAFNQWTGVQNLATVTDDGIYRVYVCEFEGDTRGSAWFCNLVCLTINPVTQKVKAYG